MALTSTNKKAILIMFGVLVIAGAGYEAYQYAMSQQLQGPLDAAKSCAVDSAAKEQHDAASVACRDNYRKAYLAVLQAELKDNSSYQKSGVHVQPLEPNAFPSQVYGAKGNDGTISLTMNGTAVQYSVNDDNICAIVLEPLTQGTSADCQFTLPHSGALQSTVHNTAYFYIPFDQSGAYLGQDKAPSSYVLGACLESGRLAVDQVNNESHALYTLPAPGTLQTTGANQQTVTCAPAQ